MTVGLQGRAACAAIQVHMQLVTPVTVVLIVDAPDINAVLAHHRLHRLATDHGEFHQFHCLPARELRAVFHRLLGIDDEMPAVVPCDVRLRGCDHVKMPGAKDQHGAYVIKAFLAGCMKRDTRF